MDNSAQTSMDSQPIAGEGANPNQRRWAEPGVLYILATPIGNRADLSERARQLLTEVDWIAAEDTRHVKRLTQQLPVRARTVALHQHNEQSATQQLLARLADGASIALVSDAGTPLISDPGADLVAAVRAAGFAVSPIPGPAAVVAALSAAGLPAQPFWFEGFLPAKKPAREQRLTTLSELSATLVFYEAPHRIEACVQSIIHVFGPEHPAAIARELTKRYEQIVNAPIGALQTALAEGEIPVRGEFVLLLGPKQQQSASAAEQQADSSALIEAMLQADIAPRAIVDVVRKTTQRPRNAVYKQVMATRNAR